MNDQLQAILADEAALLTEEQTVAAGVNTLIANGQANDALIAQLQQQIAAGNTEAADLQQIADGLKKNSDAMAPVLTALQGALPANTAPAAPASNG